MQNNCFSIIGDALVPGIPVCPPSPSNSDYLVDLDAEVRSRGICLSIGLSQDCLREIRDGRVFTAAPARQDDKNIFYASAGGSSSYFVAFDVEWLDFGEPRIKALWPGAEWEPMTPLWRAVKRPQPGEVHFRKVPKYEGWELGMEERLLVVDCRGGFAMLSTDTGELCITKPDLEVISGYVGKRAKQFRYQKGIDWARVCVKQISEIAPGNKTVARHLRELATLPSKPHKPVK
ncbi:MAG: hypothetical protein PHV42_02630 [Candidatus Pacebacteria bacterium]|nr:hypothetical protein [Candidatus Paceibacterota bacterium]